MATSTPSRQDIVEALERFISAQDQLFNPDNDPDWQFLVGAAEEQDLRWWHEMQDICVELKQEDFTTYEHPNPRITALRNKLWTGERLAEQPLGSRVPPPIPIRPGPAQIEWQQLINLLGPLPAPLADAHNDVLNALASLDRLADPTTGVIDWKKRDQAADAPTSPASEARSPPNRTVATAVLGAIDEQIVRLESVLHNNGLSTTQR